MGVLAVVVMFFFYHSFDCFCWLQWTDAKSSCIIRVLNNLKCLAFVGHKAPYSTRLDEAFSKGCRMECIYSQLRTKEKLDRSGKHKLTIQCSQPTSWVLCHILSLNTSANHAILNELADFLSLSHLLGTSSERISPQLDRCMYSCWLLFR